MTHRRGQWRRIVGWQHKAQAHPGVFHTGGVWIVITPELAQQVLVHDTDAYPLAPAFLRVNRHQSLPVQMQKQIVSALLRLLARKRPGIGIGQVSGMMTDPKKAEFQSWGIRLMRESYRQAIADSRSPVFDAAVDRFVGNVLIDSVVRGHCFTRRRKAFSSLQRELAPEIAAVRSTGAEADDLVDVVNDLRPTLSPMECAELYLRLVTALLGATGIALEWTVALTGGTGIAHGRANTRDLRHAVLETQRLYPSSWRLYREARRENTLGGHRIRAGDHVVVASSVIHRDPTLWEDPDTFRPDRWAEDAAVPPGSYLPFSDGPGICPGRGVALETIRQAAATLLCHNVAEARFTPGADPRVLALLAPPAGHLRLYARQG
ncbi:MAG TPA: cytochrome P450 [Cryptosporangiaceae bacterium]|nr:cytochrome P450 [Cryptosporangiaceae bacterium]